MHEKGRYLKVVARLVHWAIEECLLDAGSESTRSWAGSVPYGASVMRSSCSPTCSINESDFSLHDEPFFNITLSFSILQTCPRRIISFVIPLINLPTSLSTGLGYE